jgi:hypothetical protein
VIVNYLGVIADEFFGSVSVQVPPGCVNLFGDLLGCTLLAALKEHVFDKMRDAIEVRTLLTGARPDPHPQAHRADMGHELGDNPDSVWKCCARDFPRVHYR